MKMINRFALLAVLASVFGSALVMGCGGAEEPETDNAAQPSASSSAAPGEAAE